MISGKPTCISALALFVTLMNPVGLAAQSADLAAQTPQQRTRYIITDLGTLGGAADFSQANGINNKGVVVGFSVPTGPFAIHAFRWQNGIMSDLGTLGGVNSYTLDDDHPVNEKGEIVGNSENAIPDPNGEDVCNLGTHLECVPFVWTDGTMTALPLLGGNNGNANGINNRGEIVGQAEGPDPDPCSPFALQVSAVVWRNGQIERVLPAFGGSAAVAIAINDNGDAVGLSGCNTSTFNAVLWRHGTPTNLGTLGGAFGNIPFDINNEDQVVGQSDLPGDLTHHAFLWQRGVITDLGTIYDLPVSVANGINNKGQVVGFSQDLNGDFSSTVAWIWQDGTMTDLNTLVAGDSPLFLIEALGINDRGQISGPASCLPVREPGG